MANRNVTMNKLKRAFQMLAGNIPQRDICEQLRMGRTRKPQSPQARPLASSAG